MSESNNEFATASPKRGYKAVFVAFIAILCAGGIGYYAWNLRAEHMVTLDELEGKL